MSRYLYKKIQNISPESLNFQHSGLKLTTLGSDPESCPSHVLPAAHHEEVCKVSSNTGSLRSQYIINH